MDSIELLNGGLTFQEKYSQYLQSEHWFNLKLGAWIRDGKKCAACHWKSDLQGHHLIYRNLTDCATKDILTLCKRCHDRIHGYMKANRIVSGVLDRNDTIRILVKINRKSRKHNGRSRRKMINAKSRSPEYKSSKAELKFFKEKRIAEAKEDAKRPLIRLPNGSFTFATTSLPR